MVPREAKDEFAGLVLCGRFEIRRQIGRGGMASVYIATDQRMHRDVAVKFPRRELFEYRETRARFEGEIRKLANLNHKSIVKIFDVGDEDDQPYVVMQYLPGGTLTAQLRDGAVVRAPRDILRWLGEMASALDYTHEFGVVHRDVKPSNVLFDAAGGSYLSDFGIAKEIGKSTTKLTITGQSPGTPLYMGPEIASDSITGAYDQYALGVMTYQALSGRFPHEGGAPIEVMLRRRTEPARPLRNVRKDVSKAVESVVMRSLERDPERRFPTCGEFFQAFEAACDGTPYRGSTGTKVDPTRVERAAGESAEDLELAAPSSARTKPIVKQSGLRALLRSRKARALAVIAAGVVATAAILLHDHDDSALRFARAVESRPALPEPLPDATARGYRSAVDFLAALDQWKQAHPGLEARLREAPELASWNASAAAIASLRDDADHLELALEEPATRRVATRTVEIRGSVKRGKLALLDLRPACPWRARERDGVLLDVDLPPDATTVELEFRRFDGTKLAAEKFEIELLPDPAVTQLLKERREIREPEVAYTAAGFAAAKRFDEAERAWRGRVEAGSEAVRAAVASAPEWKAADGTPLAVRELLAAVGAFKLVLDAPDVREVAERTATVDLGRIEGDRRCLDVEPLAAGLTLLPAAQDAARLCVRATFPDGSDSIAVELRRIDGIVLGARTIRVRAAPVPVDPLVQLRADAKDFEQAWPTVEAFDGWRRKVGDLADAAARTELLAAPAIVMLTQRTQLGLGDDFVPAANPRYPQASTWLHVRCGLTFIAIAMTGDAATDASPATQVRVGDAVDRTRPYLLVSETECTNDAWYVRWKQEPIASGGDPRLPVVRIRFGELAEFCTAMTLDLPTVEEWEAFARSGDGTGDRVKLPSADLEKHAWYSEVAKGRASPVRGDRCPNGLGLFDLVGNVAEVCLVERRALAEWRSLAATRSNDVRRAYLGGSFQARRAFLKKKIDHINENHGFDLIPVGDEDSGELDKGFRPVFRPRPRKG